MTYNPTNQTRDGKFRKIKVELVNPGTGEPLRVVTRRASRSIHDHREAGLHGAARSRVALSQQARAALAQPFRIRIGGAAEVAAVFVLRDSAIAASTWASSPSGSAADGFRRARNSAMKPV